MSATPPKRSGSGGKGSGRRAHEREPHERRVASVGEVERDLGAEARGADAEARVAHGVGYAPAERRAEEREEAAAGVDRAAPAVREADPVELRERLEEVLGEHAERRVALVEMARRRRCASGRSRRSRRRGCGRRPSAGSSGTGCRRPSGPGGSPSRARPAAPPRAARSRARSRRPAACAAGRSAERRVCAGREHARRARTRPPGQSRTTRPAPRAARATGEPSQIRTPSSSTARRKP